MRMGGQRDAQAAFTPEKDPVPVVQEAGWAPGPVWTSAENLTPTGIRSTDLPARSELQYWLSYLGPQKCKGKLIINKFSLFYGFAFIKKQHVRAFW